MSLSRMPARRRAQRGLSLIGLLAWAIIIGFSFTLRKASKQSRAFEADFWKAAEVNLPAVKQQVTLRIDPDIVEYFKAAGQGYQTRINAVLRSYVKAHQHNK